MDRYKKFAELGARMGWIMKPFDKGGMSDEQARRAFDEWSLQLEDHIDRLKRRLVNIYAFHAHARENVEDITEEQARRRMGEVYFWKDGIVMRKCALGNDERYPRVQVFCSVKGCLCGLTDPEA